METNSLGGGLRNQVFSTLTAYENHLGSFQITPISRSQSDPLNQTLGGESNTHVSMGISSSFPGGYDI
jgi:hypothetical protein